MAHSHNRDCYRKCVHGSEPHSDSDNTTLEQFTTAHRTLFHVVIRRTCEALVNLSSQHFGGSLRRSVEDTCRDRRVRSGNRIAKNNALQIPSDSDRPCRRHTSQPVSFPTLRQSAPIVSANCISSTPTLPPKEMRLLSPPQSPSKVCWRTSTPTALRNHALSQRRLARPAAPHPA